MAKTIGGKTAREWFNLGYDAKDPETKLKCYSKALEIEPKDADAWHNKGVAFHKLGKYKEAIKCFDGEKIELMHHISCQETEEWKATEETLSDPELMANLRQGLKEEKEGEVERIEF